MYLWLVENGTGKILAAIKLYDKDDQYVVEGDLGLPFSAPADSRWRSTQVYEKWRCNLYGDTGNKRWAETPGEGCNNRYSAECTEQMHDAWIDISVDSTGKLSVNFGCNG
jgi:hypothetical protein